MNKQKFIDLLKKIEEKGISFYDTKTENFNSAWTVFSKCLTEEDLIDDDKIEKTLYLKNLNPIEYFNSKHWLSLKEKKLEQQPLCEGCGNKAYKIYKKKWDDKGEETLEDVISICNKCKVVDGEVISFKDIKQEVKDEKYKEYIKNMVENIIAQKAKQELLK